jgi:hypothetical protein
LDRITPKRAKTAVSGGINSAVDGRFRDCSAADAGIEFLSQNRRNFGMNAVPVVLTGPDRNSYHPAMIVPKLRHQRTLTRGDGSGSAQIANRITETKSWLETSQQY